MTLRDVSAERLREALEQFDREFRNTPDFANWERNLAYKWAIEVNGRRYPVKKIVSLATGAPAASFSGGPKSNDYVRNRGLTVVALQANALQASLEEILRDYLGARNTQQFGAQAEIAKIFERCKRLLSSRDLTERYPTLKVKASYGQGNWAKVPWIAFLDSRETDTTQRGVYPVILFRQDCTGCYVTLNQGVTEPIERLGARAGFEELCSTEKYIRLSAVGKALAAAGFPLDDAIDLRADPGLGQNYEASTVAH